MDPVKVRELKNVLLHGPYPPGCSKKEKFIIKRRAESYLTKGKQ